MHDVVASVITDGDDFLVKTFGGLKTVLSGALMTAVCIAAHPRRVEAEDMRDGIETGQRRRMGSFLSSGARQRPGLFRGDILKGNKVSHKNSVACFLGALQFLDLVQFVLVDMDIHMKERKGQGPWRMRWSPCKRPN